MSAKPTLRLATLEQVIAKQRRHRNSEDVNELMQRLTPGEREEVASLRDRVSDVGLPGLTDDELDRLETLWTRLKSDHPISTA